MIRQILITLSDLVFAYIHHILIMMCSLCMMNHKINKYIKCFKCYRIQKHLRSLCCEAARYNVARFFVCNEKLLVITDYIYMI